MDEPVAEVLAYESAVVGLEHVLGFLALRDQIKIHFTFRGNPLVRL